MKNSLILLPIITLVILNAISTTCAEPQTSFKEGAIGTNDVVFCDCTYDEGTSSTKKVVQSTFNFTTVNPGSVITYVSADNLKAEHPGSVGKSRGGINTNSVSLLMIGERKYGVKFQIKVYGHSPVGQTETELLNNCRDKKG